MVERFRACQTCGGDFFWSTGGGYLHLARIGTVDFFEMRVGVLGGSIPSEIP